MTVTSDLSKNSFSKQPYEPLIISVEGESFDLQAVTPFAQWHNAAHDMDCFGIRLDSGRFIDLRVVTKNSGGSLYSEKSGYYLVRFISEDDGKNIFEDWQAIER